MPREIGPGRTGRRGAGRRAPADRGRLVLGRRVDLGALRDGRAGEVVREAMLGAYRSDPSGNGSHTRLIGAACRPLDFTHQRGQIRRISCKTGHLADFTQLMGEIEVGRG
jgi:hypothetical protein